MNSSVAIKFASIPKRSPLNRYLCIKSSLAREMSYWFSAKASTLRDISLPVCLYLQLRRFTLQWSQYAMEKKNSQVEPIHTHLTSTTSTQSLLPTKAADGSNSHQSHSQPSQCQEASCHDHPSNFVSSPEGKKGEIKSNAAIRNLKGLTDQIATMRKYMNVCIVSHEIPATKFWCRCGSCVSKVDEKRQQNAFSAGISMYSRRNRLSEHATRALKVEWIGCTAAWIVVCCIILQRYSFRRGGERFGKNLNDIDCHIWCIKESDPKSTNSASHSSQNTSAKAAREYEWWSEL